MVKAEEDVIMRAWKIEVSGHRKIGRPNKTEVDQCYTKNTTKSEVQREEAQHQRTWRMRRTV